MRVQLRDELLRIHRDLGLTSIMVTHDMVEALTLADRIAVMFRGELRQLASPHDVMTKPADDYVAELVAMARRQGEQLRAAAGASS
jgi:ABC-type proline/glycine betaine transport system ATPase subunit